MHSLRYTEGTDCMDNEKVDKAGIGAGDPHSLSQSETCQPGSGGDARCQEVRSVTISLTHRAK